MWWGKGSDKGDASNETKAAAKEVKEAAKEVKEVAKEFDNKLPEREKLPKSLQSIVDKHDKDESFYDELVDG